VQFTQGLERAVAQHPDAVATICEGRTLTFAQLQDRVARLAGGLGALGIGQGERIAILAFNSDHYLEAYLGIAWLGAVSVPLNFRWSVAEIAFALNDAGCTALIVDDHHAAFVAELRQECPAIERVIHTGECPADAIDLAALIAQADPIKAAPASSDDLLALFYTGGTTGRSKGVMLTHGNIGYSGLAMLGEGLFAEGCVGLHVAPMFHLADMMQITCLILRGCTHIFLPSFSPQAVLELIARHRVTDIIMVPAMIQAVVDCPDVAAVDTSSLRNIVYGASPASETLITKTLATFPAARMTQCYGMTETAALISMLPHSEHVTATGKPSRLRSAGRAFCHTLARIVDPQGLEVSRGEIGEIVVRGPNIMAGYLNLPEATAEALRDGWLHTGDLGWMDQQGFLFIVDRAKDMIISGGENIYSAEVENAIASHPAVAANAVVGIPDPKLGECVHAVIVLRGERAMTLEDIREHCRSSIAGYKLPRSIEFRTQLPMSGAGKILKGELRSPYWEGLERTVN
jgi:acyl-CoA synthetase (AMP-forming)/AMP-acid ligase II